MRRGLLGGWLTILVLASWGLAGPGASQVASQTRGWFEFLVPGLDVPEGGPLDLSWMNNEPAGFHGFVRVRNGHFVDGKGRRLRLYGTNLTGDSALPPEEVAPRLAKRLAQLGFNCVRLHYLDRNYEGIWDDPNTGSLSAKQLARLDRFVAECAQRGIYINLNLHVARYYPDQPQAAGSDTFKMGKTLDRWYPPYIEMLKDYCRRLLDRVNPHTGHRYAEEPAIACLEINNENSLIGDYRSDYSGLPEPFLSEFKKLWTAWLKKRYQTTDRLQEVWQQDVLPLGDNVLSSESWVVQNVGGAESSVQVSDGLVRWQAKKRGLASWHLQLMNSNLPIEPGRYTLRFRARSEPGLTLEQKIMLDAPPWDTLGFSASVPLTSGWQMFEFSGDVSAPTHSGPLRLNFSLNNQIGLVEFKDIELLPGGGLGLPQGESLEQGVDVPDNQAVGARLRDYFSFLIDTEFETTQEMMRFLKKELGCRMPITDTQVTYGGAAGVVREASYSDYIDIHGYWQHPYWTLEDGNWPPISFQINNTSQVADLEGGVIAGKALHRVENKPFSVSEYNTPSPNDHGAEIFPLLAAIAGLQDWDALYAYTYSDFGHDYENPHLDKWFHLIGRSNALVHAPVGALLFRQEMVEPAADGIQLNLPKALMTDLAMGDNRSLTQVWTDLGVPLGAAWLRRFSLRVDNAGLSPGVTGCLDLPQGLRSSDTGEIKWSPDDPEGAWFALNAPEAKLLIGHIGGRTFNVGDVTFSLDARPWPHGKPAYASLALVALDQQPIATSKCMVLVASARTENQNMGWNADRTSVDMDQWGFSPPVSEMVPLTVTLLGGPVKAQSLDQYGNPRSPLPSQGSEVRLPPEAGTLWALLTRE